jgi:hypothetical protein
MEPLGKEHTQKTRRILAEEGKEFTIAEVESLRKSAFVKIREALRSKGYPVPDDDTDPA